MGENLLSGYLYFPPVETTIVPRVEISRLTANSPRYRRKSRYRLGAHHFLVYPLPPSLPLVVVRERPKLVAIRAAQAIQRRKALAILRPHVGVVYPPPAVAVVYAPVSVRRTRGWQPARRPFSRYVYPIVVFRLQALGWIGISLAHTPRPQLPSSFLRPPMV